MVGPAMEVWCAQYQSMSLSLKQQTSRSTTYWSRLSELNEAKSYFMSRNK